MIFLFKNKRCYFVWHSNHLSYPFWGYAADMHISKTNIKINYLNLNPEGENVTINDLITYSITAVAVRTKARVLNVLIRSVCSLGRDRRNYGAVRVVKMKTFLRQLSIIIYGKIHRTFNSCVTFFKSNLLLLSVCRAKHINETGYNIFIFYVENQSCKSY